MGPLPEPLRQALAGRYDLEEMVGRGGMATVYRARDPKHGRTVAVKVLRSDLGELIGPERFLREIEVAARLMHPHILPLYDSGRAILPPLRDAERGSGGEALYYVMPFVADESLRGLLARVRLVDTEGAVEIVERIAAALDYAHAQGILHRDIKPENILLPGGQAVLADFGIAKAVSSATDAANLTRTGIALGTPGYMSPEQAAGLLDLNRATDIYSLGVVAYEMLIGGLPRVWVTPDALASGRFVDAAPDHRVLLDRLPAGIERALVRALALRPEERYPTAGEFASALTHPETVTLRVSPAPVPSYTPARVPAAGGIGAVTGATGGFALPARGSPGFLGAPTRLVVDRVVDGIVPPDEYDFLLEEIRAALRRVGYAAKAGSSLYWTARKPKEPMQGLDLGNLWETMQSDEAPDIMVRLVTRQRQTRIRIEQRLGDTAGGLFGGLLGGLGGGGAATLLGIALPLGAPALIVIPGAVAIAGGTWVMTRAIFRAVVANRRRALEDLADRLAEQCEELAG
jgi:serine/threonine protein kinase